MSKFTQKNILKRSVSTVIPTYAGRKLFEKYLPAVFSTMRHGDELVVVEDTGPDDTVPWMKKQFKMKQVESIYDGIDLYKGKYTKGKKEIDVVLLYNIENQRFGETSNRGVIAAKHDLIFLINNDVAPHKFCLEKLIPHFKDDLVFGVGPLEIEHGNKTGKNKLWFERGRFIHSAAKIESGPTAWISGGSGLFSRSKYLEIGGFNKLYYPAYWEDIDLSFKARKKGWKVLFEKEAVVDHNHETTNATVFGQRKMDKMSWKNGSKFTWKNGDFWQKISYLLWKPYWMLLRS